MIYEQTCSKMASSSLNNNKKFNKKANAKKLHLKLSKHDHQTTC